MLPIRVSVLSSAPCTRSDASGFVHEFLSDDANSGSFACSYLRSLAQALDEDLLARNRRRRLARDGAANEGGKKRRRKGVEGSMQGAGSGDGENRLGAPQGSPGGREPGALELERKSGKRKFCSVDNGGGLAASSAEEVGVSGRDDGKRPAKRMRSEEEEWRDTSPHRINDAASRPDLAQMDRAADRSVILKEQNVREGNIFGVGHQGEMLGSFSQERTDTIKKRKRKKKIEEARSDGALKKN